MQSPPDFSGHANKSGPLTFNADELARVYGSGTTDDDYWWTERSNERKYESDVVRGVAYAQQLSLSLLVNRRFHKLALEVQEKIVGYEAADFQRVSREQAEVAAAAPIVD